MRRMVLAAAVLAAALAGTVPAVAEISQPTVVSANPVDWTPHVLDGTVRAIALTGDRVVVGGDFSSVADAVDASGPVGGSHRYQAWFLFAFDRRTGTIDPAFSPDLDGPVYALAAGPDGTVYAGGAFRVVNGVRQRGLARLDLATGASTAGFSASINGADVRTVLARDGTVYAGGGFTAVNGVARTALARLDGTTGAVDPAFNARLTAPELSKVRVEDMALSPDGRRLAVAGALTRAAGLPRAQLAMLDTAAGAPLDWYTDAYRSACRRGFETYLRGIDFSPDGSYIVVVSTGRLSGPELMCDTAARFEAGGAGRHDPTWVNHTGGDSLYAVAVTGSAVYVGGHQRWMNNPRGHENAGPGAVAREGIAAIDPVSGLALSWNPTRSRGIGVRAFAAAPEGLYLGSDTDRLGREYHARIGLFPL